MREVGADLRLRLRLRLRNRLSQRMVSFPECLKLENEWLQPSFFQMSTPRAHILTLFEESMYGEGLYSFSGRSFHFPFQATPFELVLQENTVLRADPNAECSKRQSRCAQPIFQQA